jgi:hypothetical protein
MSDTLHARPTPKRPQYGLLAWQATVRYICTEYNPNAMLIFRAYVVRGGVIAWTATLSWGTEMVEVKDMPSLGIALSELWLEVEKRHKLLKTFEAMAKRPIDYEDDQWLDPQTEYIFDHLIRVTYSVFTNDWTLAIFYQPVETAETRVQAMIMANKNRVRINGQGPAMEEACRALFANAAREYAAFNKQE